MASDLIVKPSYQLKATDILTVDKLNLMATPVVELALEEPVNDQNFLRNGNFYSAFWKTPAGISCPVGVDTTNASYWLVNPSGAAVMFLRSSTVPDQFSLFSGQITGAAGVIDVRIGQQVNGDLSATLRRSCTFSGYIENNSGLSVSPKLEFWTCNAFNNFAALTLQMTINLQTCPNAQWTYCTATEDLSTIANMANGLEIRILLPSPALGAAANSMNFSRLKLQIGQIATQFADDVSLFVTTPTIDSTMLQDGCIARPTLFAPNVIPAGAYQAKSINNGDINDGAINGRTLAGASTTLSSGFTQPAVAATVPIAVVSTAGFAAAQAITIAVGGAYTVQSVTDATHMVVTNTGASGNAAPATSVPTSGAVTLPPAVIANLGYVPVNKAGDTGIGALGFANDDVVGSGSVTGAAAVVTISSANAANDGYMPAISFNRPGKFGRAVGLATTGRFKTVDNTGLVGYLLDTVTGVDTNSYQNASITLPKLAQSLINLLISPGVVQGFAGPSPPAGWIVCDGSAVSRTTYAALFAAIGTYWGAGDSISTFNVPDLRGRAPIGYVNIAAPGITGRGFGTRGGEETHTLALAEIPSHAHPITDQQHTHTEQPHTHTYVNPLGGFGSQAGSSQYSPSGTATTSQNQSVINATFTGINTTQAQGGNGAHNVMQPYAVLYFIIKT